MRIAIMRWIDRWVGVPLVAVLVGLYRLWWLIARPERPGTVERIAFLGLSELGSTIIADPAVRRARALFPRAEIYFVIFAGNQDCVGMLGTIDPRFVLAIREDSFLPFVRDSLAAVRRLRRVRTDIVIDLELFSRYTSILSLLSGAPIRSGFHRFFNEGLYRGNHLTHPVQYNPHQHMAKNFLALVHAATEEPGIVPHSKRRFEDAEIRLEPYRDGAASAALGSRLVHAFPVLARTRSWIILNANSSHLIPLRRWPLENFGQLARRLLDDPDVAVLMTGVAAERGDAQEIARMAASERAIDLTGRTRLDELPALYALCAMMLTNDSGPAHIAALTGLKTWVLFGPETPALYGALNPNAEFIYKGLACSPCVSAANHRRSPCADNQCMKQITVEEVFARMRGHLDALKRQRLPDRPRSAGERV
jgi:ADP-heptose:LPS heptosyltransferase